MLSSLAKLVMLTAAFLAAAPPGACCWGTAKAASPKTGACCQKKATPTKQAPILPTAPKASCCCQQPVTEQTKVSVERGDELAAPLFEVATTKFTTPTHFAGAFNAPLADGGPPLNLLHCVWRC